MEKGILLISINSHITKVAKKLSTEMGIKLDIYDGGILREGHTYARLNGNNYSVIVSSAGTSEEIRKLVKVPVVSIETDIVDFLNAIYKARQYKSQIGMVLYRSKSVLELHSLREYMGVDFTIFDYAKETDLLSKINDAIKLGQITLVGNGDCISEIAKRQGLNYVLVEVGEDKIRDALLQALNISKLSKMNLEFNKRYQILLEYSEEGIITFSDNVITSINPAAERICDVLQDNVLNKSIDSISSEFIKELYGQGVSKNKKVMEINNKNILVNRIPIIISKDKTGLVIIFQEISKIRELEQKIRSELLRKGHFAKYNFRDIVGESQVMKDTVLKAKKYANNNYTVLISSETGTGKELFAQSIHNSSGRRNNPFIAINCAALPESLLESELFGYEEGAFTGAKRGGKMGLFELAHKGTIFLDEISEIPLGLQGRLLRVLQEREINRVGSDYVKNIDIRIIAATNLDLYEKVREGRFREDLFFRLNVLNLQIPPLRERGHDILLILETLLKRMNSDINVASLNKEIVDHLLSYKWPGNVRELENFAQKMDVLLGAEDISSNNSIVKDICFELKTNLNSENDFTLMEDSMYVQIGDLKDMESEIIVEAFKRFDGNKTILADRLGISRTTLWKRLKELDLE